MFGIILILLLFPVIDSIQIGRIENNILIELTANNSLFNITLDECICQMIQLNGLITSLNYFQANETCQLFSYNITSISITFFMNSSFIFNNQTFIVITAVKSNTTIFSSGWNSTGMTVAGITGSPGTASNQLTNPFGVTLDSLNTLFIADRGNNRIQKYLSSASYGTTVAGQSNGASGTGLNYLTGPGNVNVDSNGNMYVTEIFNYRVLFWANGSSSGTLVAGNGTAGSLNNLLNQPHDIAYDWNTSILYISEYANHRVMQYLPGALSGSVVAGGNGQGYSNTQLYNPVGLYFDSLSNSLFIANFGAHNIVRWVVGSSSWTLVAGFGGSSGSTSTLLNNPGDVTLDSMGNVYVADTVNHRIQFFLAGQSNGTTVAGITASSGSDSTQLNLPFGVTVDRQFNIYIADYGNHRIQKFLFN